MSKHFLTITQALCIAMLTTLLGVASANSNSAIALSSIVELEVVAIDEQGKQKVTRVPAEKVTPGSEVIYTTRFKHNGSTPAADIVISNPIPEHTVYKLNSATGENTQTMFSVDGGRTFHLPNELKVIGQDGATRVAEAKDYTDIRWTYQGELKPGDEGAVEFRVVLK